MPQTFGHWHFALSFHFLYTYKLPFLFVIMFVAHSQSCERRNGKRQIRTINARHSLEKPINLLLFMILIRLSNK